MDPNHLKVFRASIPLSISGSDRRRSRTSSESIKEEPIGSVDPGSQIFAEEGKMLFTVISPLDEGVKVISDY